MERKNDFGIKRFWKKCAQVAKAKPELSAEEVEFKATLIHLHGCDLTEKIHL